MIAIGNSREPKLVGAALIGLKSPSPLVRGAAAWALAQLDSARAKFLASTALAEEHDENVRTEWLGIMSDDT